MHVPRESPFSPVGSCLTDFSHLASDLWGRARRIFPLWYRGLLPQISGSSWVCPSFKGISCYWQQCLHLTTSRNKAISCTLTFLLIILPSRLRSALGIPVLSNYFLHSTACERIQVGINYTDMKPLGNMSVQIAHLPHGIMCQGGSSNNMSGNLIFPKPDTTHYRNERCWALVQSQSKHKSMLLWSEFYVKAQLCLWIMCCEALPFVLISVASLKIRAEDKYA